MKKFYIYIYIFLFIIFFSSCNINKKYKNKYNSNIETESVNANYNLKKEKEEMILYIEKKDYNLNLYEPEKGAYIGVYIKEENDENIKIFENLVEKQHAFYTFKTKLQEKIPTSFILKCISRAKTPNIIVTPLNYKNPFDETYLEEISKEYAQLYVPIFLNFYPYESNKYYNKEEYINFYKKAKEIFKRNAPNVAFVWSINENDILNSSDYYPGDDYVDWVCIEIYETLENKDNVNKDIFNILDYFYYTYQGRKPIMITLGVSHFSNEDYIYKTLEASIEIEKIYNTILDNYHNIKGINYVNINEINKQKNNKKHNFLVTDDEEILNAYKSSIKNENCLSTVKNNLNKKNIDIFLKSPFSAYKIENEIYISKRSFTHNLRNIDLDNIDKYLININNEKYYNINVLKENKNYEVEIENKKIFIKNRKF